MAGHPAAALDGGNRVPRPHPAGRDVAALCKADGSPLDNNPVDSLSMDVRKNPYAWALTYWVRGGELLNVWLAYYEPNSDEFEADEGDWFPVDQRRTADQHGPGFCR